MFGLRVDASQVLHTAEGTVVELSTAELLLPPGASTEVTLAQILTTLGGTVSVSGAFWQSTQPVSIAAMPTTPVTGTFWQATQPVSGPLTDAQLRANPVPVSLGASGAMTWVGVKSAAPAANAVQATTGPLTAGNYDFDIELCAADTVAVGKGLVIEHRNAADSATLFVLGACPAAGSRKIELRRYPIATNERIRVIAGTAAGAASSMYVSAIGRRVS